MLLALAALVLLAGLGYLSLVVLMLRTMCHRYEAGISGQPNRVYTWYPQ